MIDQFSNLISAEVSYALGWTIIHSLWQVSIIAMVMSALHSRCKHKSPELRYNISVASMIAVLASSVVTFMIYYSPKIVLDQSTTQLLGGQNHVSNTSFEYGVLESLLQFFNNNVDHINLIWTLGVLVFATKLIFSYGYVKFVKHSAISIDNNILFDTLGQIKSKMNIKKYVQIGESKMINVPMVMGYFKPIILFPIGMINVLNPKEVEAIIVHELSHIKRNDYLMNIGLSILEILFYYHPAMWWISANVKAERENCCDDAAMNHNIDSVTYAKALLKLEELRKSGIPALAMPFASNKHQLLNRIKRILNMEQTKNDIREKSVATVLLLFVAILFASNTVTPNFNSSEDIETTTVKTSIDTVKLVGEDKIVVEIDKGIFSTLKVDGKEIESGEMVDHLKNLFSDNPENTFREDQTFYMKGNPILEFQNNSFRHHGDESHFYVDNKNIRGDQIKMPLLQDTLPEKMHVDHDKATIVVDKDGQRIEVELENGETSGLKIDGKEIPKSEFGLYQDQIDSVTKNFSFKKGNFNVFEFDTDFDQQFEFDNIDSMLSHSFGMIFDGENWEELEGNLENFLDEDVILKLKELEDLRPLEGLEGLERLEELENIEGFEKLKNFRGFQDLEDMQPMFDQMEIQLDSTMEILRFELNNLEDFKGFDGFEFFSDDNMHIRGNDNHFGNSTVVDKIGNMLNRDGLLEEYKMNKIEITGKHLKINGEKMPKALYNKYKNIYQESTGAPLTKKSKMVFEIEGKPSKRKVRSF